MNFEDTTPGIRLIRAAALADADTEHAPGGLLVETTPAGSAILASGRPDDVAEHPGARQARLIDLPGAVVLPALVNAHTHLDLTHIGPVPFDPAGGFAGWAKHVIARRLTEDEPIADSVRAGIDLCLRGGVGAVGDITGASSFAPIRAVRQSPLAGVCYFEVFGRGRDESQAVATLERLARPGETGVSIEDARVRLGTSPHAPYSAGLSVLRAAAQLAREHGMPACTHLAESSDERDYIADRAGGMLEFLKVWDVEIDDHAHDLGHGDRPIAYVLPALEHARGGILAAHCNDITDDELGVLAETGTHVVYCPRSSEYFRQHEAFGPHRYRDMLAAGINVCIGTDSILNIPPGEADRLSPLDEIRFLRARDGELPRVLFELVTIAGLRALGMDESLGRLDAGPVLGLIAVEAAPEAIAHDPLAAVLDGETSPRWVVTPR